VGPKVAWVRKRAASWSEMGPIWVHCVDETVVMDDVKPVTERRRAESTSPLPESAVALLVSGAAVPLPPPQACKTKASGTAYHHLLTSERTVMITFTIR